MLLYSNAKYENVLVRIVVDYNPLAKVSNGQNFHTITAEVDGQLIVDNSEIHHDNLIREVESIRQKAFEIVKIINTPEKDETIQWLRANSFNFNDIK